MDDKDVSHSGPVKRKLSEASCCGDEKAKRPRLQVTIPRIQLSEKQLKKLQKSSTKHPTSSLIANKGDEKKSGVTLNISGASSTSTAQTVTEAATTAMKETIRTVIESPVRHRLSNLLDGSDLSPYCDSAAHRDDEEGNVKSVNCEGDDYLNNANSLSGPASAKANLFNSDELLSVDDGCSPVLQDEDCITVPCYPDVVSKTCMQVTEASAQTSSDNNSQVVSAVTASTQDTCNEEHEENQRVQSASDDAVSNIPEQGPEPRSATPGSCDVALGELLNDILLPENEETSPEVAEEEKRSENGNAEDKGTSAMLSSAGVEDNTIDYASHYNTLEVMNTLLTNVTEEKRARAELEQLVTQLEEKNKELVSECEKLKDLVNDLLPLSKVKSETVSRGIQINMDVSLRRGRAVDRATSPLRIQRDPSPELTLVSFSIGSQTNPEEVDPPKEVVTTACQTDPQVELRLPARCATQTVVPARVQGIVMPNIQGRTPIQLPDSGSKGPNPFQELYSQSSPSLSMQSGQGAVAQQRQMMTKQVHTTHQYPTSILQTAGYNATGYHSGTLNSARTSQPSAAAQYPQANATSYHSGTLNSARTSQPSAAAQYPQANATGCHSGTLYSADVRTSQPSSTAQYAQANATGYHSGTLNSADVRTSKPSSTAQYAQSSSDYFMSPLLTAHWSGNQTHAGSNPRAYSVGFNTGTQGNAMQYSPLSAGQAPQRDTSNQTTGQFNPGTLSLLLANNNQLLTQNYQLLAQNHLPASNQTRTLDQNALYNYYSRAAQYVGTQQHSTQQQMIPTSTLDAIGNARSAMANANGKLQMQMAAARTQSFRNSQQTLGTFTSSGVATNQATTPQRTEGLPLRHQVSQPATSQVQLHPASMPQNQAERLSMSNGSTMIRQQSQQVPSSTQTSNRHHNSQTSRLLERDLDQRVQTHIEALSLYGEVQQVYNELQRHLTESTSHNKQKQRTADDPANSHAALVHQPVDNQLNQLQRSKRKPSNEQPREVVPCSNPVSSVSEPISNQFQDSTNQVCSSQTVTKLPQSDRSLSEDTVERSVHFRQETHSSIEPADVFSGTTPPPNDNNITDMRTGHTISSNQSCHSGITFASPSTNVDDVHKVDTHGSNRLGSSATRQQASRLYSIDKDPYKIPPKTPSGALEDTVQRLLALQNKISTSENVSDKESESSISPGELTDGISKATGTMGSEQESATSDESVSQPKKDSNNESLQDCFRNPEQNTVETVSLSQSQGTDTEGLKRDKNTNNCDSPGNQDNPTKDISDSSASEGQLATVVDKMQPIIEQEEEAEGNEIANEKEIGHSPIAEEEEQAGAVCDVPDNRVANVQDALTTSSSDLNNEDESGDKDGTNCDENDDSFQDLYVDLMSPVIPRMAVARRVRRCSDVPSAEYVVGDDDASNSSVDASVQNADNDDHNKDPEPTQSIHEKEQTVKDSNRESGIPSSPEPSADADCDQQENGSGTEGSEHQDVVNDHISLSRDEETPEEMEVEEDMQPTSTSSDSSTAGNDAKEAACHPNPQEMTSAHLGEEHQATVASERTYQDPQAHVSNGQQENTSSIDGNEGCEASNDQEPVAMPLSPKDSTEEMQVEDSLQGASSSVFSTVLNNIEQAAHNTEAQTQDFVETNSTHLSSETSEECRDPPGLVPRVHMKLEASNGPCMGGIGQMDNNEQQQNCELNPEAIPKQNFVCFNSTFEESSTMGDIDVTTKHLSKLPLPLEEGMVKRSVDGKNVSGILVDSNTTLSNIDHNRKESPENKEPSQQLNKPRLALRVLNGSIVLMWDLPPDNKVSEVDFFEVCVYLNKDAREWQNCGGQWMKIGQMKALQLPMACTIRHMLQKKTIYNFSVRAVGLDGVAGPFSQPCGLSCV